MKKTVYLLIIFLSLTIIYNSCIFNKESNRIFIKEFNKFLTLFKEYSLPISISPQELGKYIVLGDYESDIDSLDVVKFLLSRESVIKYNTNNEVYKKGIRFELSNNKIMLIVPRVIYNTPIGTESIEIIFYLFAKDGEFIYKKTLGTINELTYLSFNLTSDNIVVSETTSIVKNDSIVGSTINTDTYTIQNGIMVLKE